MKITRQTWPSVDENILPEGDRAKIEYQARMDQIGQSLTAAEAHQHDLEKADHEALIATAKAEKDAQIADEARNRETEIAIEGVDSNKFIAWQTANRDADVANSAKFHEMMYTLVAGSVERTRAGAELVQKGSAAIAALYTAALGLAFSVTDNPLPVRGMLAPIFLGLAVVLSTAFIAYLGPTKGFTPGPTPVLGLEPKSFQRLNAFIRVTSSIATRRSGFLRASVVSLGIGLAFIAAPFLNVSSGADTSAPDAVAAWPTPTPNIPEGLDAILYQAQVDEVAAQRMPEQDGTLDPGADLVILAVGLIIGGAAVIVVPLIFRGDGA